jgi:hypothetical protein
MISERRQTLSLNGQIYACCSIVFGGIGIVLVIIRSCSAFFGGRVNFADICGNVYSSSSALLA